MRYIRGFLDILVLPELFYIYNPFALSLAFLIFHSSNFIFTSSGALTFNLIGSFTGLSNSTQSHQSGFCSIFFSLLLFGYPATVAPDSFLKPVDFMNVFPDTVYTDA